MEQDFIAPIPASGSFGIARGAKGPRSRNLRETIYHLVPKSEFQAQVENNTYIAARFDQDGFIHCTGDVDAVLAVANDYFSGMEEPMLVLVIETTRVKAEVRFEPPAPVEGGGGSHLEHARLFPHIYGPLNMDAVVEMGVLQKDSDGYRWPNQFSKPEFPWTG
jgi:uncharacterized protein (DUF952 family)